jgi:hypothetical protein
MFIMEIASVTVETTGFTEAILPKSRPGQDRGKEQ